MFKKLFLTIIGSITSFSIPFCYAQSTNSQPVCGDGAIQLPGCKKIVFESVTTLSDTFIPKLIVYVLGLTGVLAIITIMGGGLMYVTSMGNEAKAKKATKVIWYSLMGLIGALLSYAIIQLVVNLEFT